MLCNTLSLSVGLKFWKAGSRKIYCVEAVVIHKLMGKGKRRANNSDTESDNEFPLVKKHKPCPILKAVNSLREEVLKRTIPPRLYTCLSEAFKCNICLMIMKPPISYASCCRGLLAVKVVLQDVMSKIGIVLSVKQLLLLMISR